MTDHEVWKCKEEPSCGERPPQQQQQQPPQRQQQQQRPPQGGGGGGGGGGGHGGGEPAPHCPEPPPDPICKPGQTRREQLDELEHRQEDKERQSKEAVQQAEALKASAEDLRKAVNEIEKILEEYRKCRPDLLCRHEEFEKYYRNQLNCLPHGLGECAGRVEQIYHELDVEMIELSKRCKTSTQTAEELGGQSENAKRECEARQQEYEDCKRRKELLEKCFEMLAQLRTAAGKAEDENCIALAWYIVKWRFNEAFEGCPGIPTWEELDREIHEKWCAWREACRAYQEADLRWQNAKQDAEKVCAEFEQKQKTFGERIEERIREECCQPCEKGGE